METRGLSDEQVAVAIDVSRVTVSRIRRRKVRPDWSTIGKLKDFSAGEITADDFQDLPEVGRTSPEPQADEMAEHEAGS